MTPKKPDWFELTEGGDAYAGIQKVNKKLPIATLALAGAVILGGSFFATANNEPSAVAGTPSATQSLVTSQPSASADTSPSASAAQGSTLIAPTVANAPQRGDGDREGRDGDHEERNDD